MAINSNTSIDTVLSYIVHRLRTYSNNIRFSELLSSMPELYEEYKRKSVGNLSDVYVLQQHTSNETKMYKIGVSQDWKERFRGHKTSNPLIEYVTHYKAPAWVEKNLHKLFDKQLVLGCTEWFHYYDGMEVDIDKQVKSLLKLQEDCLLSYDDFESAVIEAVNKSGNLNVYKFKDLYRNDYAFVIATSLKKAEKLLSISVFVDAELVQEKSLADARVTDYYMNTEYVYLNQIRTITDYKYCKANKIDYNKEYGKTVKRLTTQELIDFEVNMRGSNIRFKGERNRYNWA